jgi:hypothetical protein
MIIAPGAVSPEDSLESFGIDSPFNWKQSGASKSAAAPAEGQPAPSGRSRGERVDVENGEGEILPTESDYDAVERAGSVVSAEEFRSDGRLDRTKDGQIFGRSNVQVDLAMDAGRTAAVDSVYTIFRDDGPLRTHGADPKVVGELIENVGVLRVTRVDEDGVVARIEKQYNRIMAGDLIRPRDPERLKYYSLLRQGPSTAPKGLRAEVLGLVPPSLFAHRGDVVYLNIGRAKGALPGMRLLVTRGEDRPGPDDPNELMPMGPISPTLAQSDDLRALHPTGRIGVVEVINVTHDACVARVVESEGEIRAGDEVRYH